jgi:ATP-binding cassette subfamily G (WHITE) protein 2 (PDR)
MSDIEDYNQRHTIGGDRYQKFLESRKLDQSDGQRENSPFTLSYTSQIALTGWRSWTLLKSDPSIIIAMLTINIFEALIIVSIFYNLSANTTALYRRGFLLLMVVLLNAFACILEIFTLYAKRRIIEKHSRYAFYHPSAEAISAIAVNLLYNIANVTIVNITMYFMGNLRREAGAFFFFFLFSVVTMLTMSMMFRTIGSFTKSVSQAMGPAAIILLLTVLYSGFAIPSQYMMGWIGWIRWLNPIYYVIESVFINEFSGQDFACTNFIPSGPGYEAVSVLQRACSTAGSIPGQDFVSGSAYLVASFGFIQSHRWRNFGILVVFLVLFFVLHLFGIEYVSAERSKGEVLVFTRSTLKSRSKRMAIDAETGATTALPLTILHALENEIEKEKRTSVFHWKDVCYDIQVKGEPQRILDHGDGWIKPGTLTALMVSSPLALRGRDV